ncbi:hypothetical protein TIFTF001_004057 [Ficus carica]|uniref:Uncharacterized protein n=1 Tax=Ficus carica TaxID=3494 RepID=A0AA88CSL4_FICCA|nr:hypothetical protein TIFTF001_004057 [Ficus carica]
MKQSGAMDPFIIASKILSIGCNTDAATHNQSTDAGITESVSRHSEMEGVGRLRGMAGGPIAEMSTMTTAQWPASRIDGHSFTASPPTGSRAFYGPANTIIISFLDEGGLPTFRCDHM